MQFNRKRLKILIDRLNINKELEKELDNAGGYTIDYLNENNPKTELHLTYFII